MKKTITFASLCLSAGMIIALANAEDKTTSTDNYNPGQAGTADTSTTDNTNRMSGEPANTGESSVRSSESTETKTAKSCTDSHGVSYAEGKQGFKECMKSMEKKRTSDMGG